MSRSSREVALSSDSAPDMLDAPVPLAHHLGVAGVTSDDDRLCVITDEPPPVRVVQRNPAAILRQKATFSPPPRPRTELRYGPPPVQRRSVDVEFDTPAATTFDFTDEELDGTLEPVAPRAFTPTISDGRYSPALLVAGGMLLGLATTFVTMLLNQ